MKKIILITVAFFSFQMKSSQTVKRTHLIDSTNRIFFIEEVQTFDTNGNLTDSLYRQARHNILNSTYEASQLNATGVTVFEKAEEYFHILKMHFETDLICHFIRTKAVPLYKKEGEALILSLISFSKK